MAFVDGEYFFKSTKWKSDRKIIEMKAYTSIQKPSILYWKMGEKQAILPFSI
jgi:hypothetical protein